MENNPSDKARKVRKLFMKLSNFIGVHMPGNPKFHPRLAFVLFCCSMWIIMIINGFISVWGDPVKVCHAMFPTALVIVYLGRTANLYIYNSEEIDEKLQEKTEKFFEKWENSEKHRKILEQRIIEGEQYTKVFIAMTGIMYLLPAIMTDLDNLISGSQLLYVYSVIPFIDPESSLGFYLNSIMLNIGAPLAFVSLIILDSMFVFYGYQTVPMVDIMCIQIEELSKDLDSKKLYDVSNEDLKTSQPSRHQNFITLDQIIFQNQRSKMQYFNDSPLRDIILEHRKYNQFINDIINLMKLPCFLTVVFNSLSIALSIVVLFNISIRLGLSVGMIFISQVLSPCLIGTLIQSQNERLLQNLMYFPWQNLSKNEKKTFLEFIHVLQNTALFELPIVGVLNMELFTKVMNASYSYFTFFLNFVSH